MHNPEPVLENDTYKLIWDGSPNLGQKTRPNNNEKKKNLQNCGFAAPADYRIKLK